MSPERLDELASALYERERDYIDSLADLADRDYKLQYGHRMSPRQLNLAVRAICVALAYEDETA